MSATVRKIGTLAVLLLIIFASGAYAGFDDIHISSYSLILMPEKDFLEVREIIVLENFGETYFGEENGIIFPLPSQATEFEILQGLRDDEVNVTTEGVELLIPIPLGEKKFVYRYKLPNVGNDHYRLPVETTFFTRELILLAPTDAEVSAGDLNLLGVVQMTEELSFNQYARVNLSPGSWREVIIRTAEIGSDRITRGYNGAYHNPSHIRFWNGSPFRRFEPHVFIIIILLAPIILVTCYARKLWKLRKAERESELVDQEERLFQKLHLKLTLMEKKMAELESGYARGDIGRARHELMKKVLEEKMDEIRGKIAMYLE